VRACRKVVRAHALSLEGTLVALPQGKLASALATAGITYI